MDQGDKVPTAAIATSVPRATPAARQQASSMLFTPIKTRAVSRTKAVWRGKLLQGPQVLLLPWHELQWERGHGWLDLRGGAVQMRSVAGAVGSRRRATAAEE
jgi:hypothetical protein